MNVLYLGWDLNHLDHAAIELTQQISQTETCQLHYATGYLLLFESQCIEPFRVKDLSLPEPSRYTTKRLEVKENCADLEEHVYLIGSYGSSPYV